MADRRISTKTMFKNPWWEYRLDLYKLPSGIIGEYHYIYSIGSAIIIPKISNDKFLLVRQYRYLNDKLGIEFPGGGFKKGVLPISNARKELIEETGYDAKFLKLIGEFNPCNGITNEMCKVYFADSLIEKLYSPEDTEEIELLKLTSHQIRTFIKRGDIWDGMTIAAWSIFCDSKYFAK